MERRKPAPERRDPDRYDSDRRKEHQYPADEKPTEGDRRDSQRRIDQLNDRIEALRAIERSFARPNPAPAAPKPAT